MTLTLEPENAHTRPPCSTHYSVLLCITQFVMAHKLLLDVHNELSGAYHHTNCHCLPLRLKHLHLMIHLNITSTRAHHIQLKFWCFLYTEYCISVILTFLCKSMEILHESLILCSNSIKFNDVCVISCLPLLCCLEVWLATISMRSIAPGSWPYYGRSSLVSFICCSAALLLSAQRC